MVQALVDWLASAAADLPFQLPPLNPMQTGWRWRPPKRPASSGSRSTGSCTASAHASTSCGSPCSLARCSLADVIVEGTAAAVLCF